MWVNLVTPGITLLVAIVAGAIMWGMFKQDVKDQEQEIEQIKKNCDERKHVCSEELCRKVDELKTLVGREAVERRRDRESYTEEIIDFKKDVNATFRDIERFTGRVDEALDTLKKIMSVHPIKAERR